MSPTQEISRNHQNSEISENSENQRIVLIQNQGQYHHGQIPSETEEVIRENNVQNQVRVCTSSILYKEYYYIKNYII